MQHYVHLNLTPAEYAGIYGIDVDDDIGDCFIRAAAFAFNIGWKDVMNICFGRDLSLRKFFVKPGLPVLVDQYDEAVWYPDSLKEIEIDQDSADEWFPPSGMMLPARFIPNHKTIIERFKGKISRYIELPEYRYYRDANDRINGKFKKKRCTVMDICRISLNKKYKNCNFLLSCSEGEGCSGPHAYVVRNGHYYDKWPVTKTHSLFVEKALITKPVEREIY